MTSPTALPDDLTRRPAPRTLCPPLPRRPRSRGASPRCPTAEAGHDTAPSPDDLTRRPSPTISPAAPLPGPRALPSPDPAPSPPPMTLEPWRLPTTPTAGAGCGTAPPTGLPPTALALHHRASPPPPALKVCFTSWKQH
nr:proline-rich receptor-like protein kinase PERK9 [Aegilops tauschii subsp. strangulata]